jgi:hypothetical protein
MRRRPDIIWREVDGRVVGLDLRSSRYFSLNRTGARLWALLGEDTDSDALVEALVSTSAVDRAVAAADVEAFLRSMRENGLVES